MKWKKVKMSYRELGSIPKGSPTLCSAYRDYITIQNFSVESYPMKIEN